MPVIDSSLKSAVQKYVRRGEIGKAVAIAEQILAVGPPGLNWLQRRLPILAVEDVGWEWLPRVGDVAQSRLVETVASLSALPKNKEAYWLCVVVEDRLKHDQSTSATAFAQALSTVNLVEASRCGIIAHRSGSFSLEGYIPALLSSCRSPLARQLVETAVNCLMLGPGEWDDTMLLNAAILAASEDVKEPSVWPSLANVEAALEPIAWYCFDGHTKNGSTAIASLVEELGLGYEILRELMFSFESTKLGPSVRASRWESEALAIIACDSGYEDHLHGVRLWAQLGPVVHRRIAAQRATEAKLSGT